MAVSQRGRDERDLVADRAAKDRSGAEVHAVRGDRAFRAARLARVRHGGHLRAEELLKETAQRVAVQPSRVFAHLIPPVAPNRSRWIAAVSWPRSTSRSAARSTKAVGPQTKIRGRCDGAGPTRLSMSASILRAKPDQPAGGSRGDGWFTA